jgi:signal transduction histidine kinase
MFRRLSRLLSPFRGKDPFTIRIESDEFPEYSGELRSDPLDRAPYRIEARFDGEQTIAVSLGNGRPVEHRWNGHGELACGPVRVRLFAFDLEAEALARIGPRMEVRAWLKEWTGVSVYRDGFRIWPYGEPHDDWLRLDQRRVNNPVQHLSNNQVIGFIDVGRDANPDLIDQTNREGLVHNQALEDLRRLVYFVLQILEAERQSIRHPTRRALPLPGIMSPETPSLPSELEELAGRAGGDVGDHLRRIGRQLAERFAADEASRKRAIEGYSALAAIGQMAVALYSSVPPEVGRIEAELSALRGSLQQSAVPAARESLDRVADAVERVREQVRMMGLVASGDRRGKIDLVAEIHSFQEMIQPQLVLRDARMEIESPRQGVLRIEMRPENFHCLIQILTSNALDWMPSRGERRIRVVLAAREAFCSLTFSDSGPGIPEDIAGRVFEPLFSRKEGGRGMGLTIARNIVESHGGQLYLLQDGRRRGANFRLLLPRKRPRATYYNGQ